MPKKTVKDLRDLKGTHAFVRVDYNVPLEDGRITDDTRIRASLPTLEHLIKGGARLALGFAPRPPEEGTDAGAEPGAGGRPPGRAAPS